MDTILGIALIASIVGFAMVNAIEISVVGANRLRVRHMAEAGNGRARVLERLHNNQERFFAAIVLLQNILGYVASVTASILAIDVFGNVGIVFAAVTPFVMTLFGELTPKVLAAQASDRFALTVAWPAELLTRVLFPFVWVLSLIPGYISKKLFGVSLEAGPSVSEGELRMLIGISAESGNVNEEEAELLENVFHFGDRQLHEVMIPRTEAVWLEKDSMVSDFYQVYAESPHSRFPVYDDTPDHVVGILVIKDVLAAIASGKINGSDTPIAALVRPAYLVPETKLIVELFREMQKTGTQMAIAIDEFGGTAGIVTMEQLLEEMFGPMHDELGPDEAEITPIDDHTSQVDGSLSIVDARDELGIEIPEGPYDTVAGFVLSRLGHIPKEGEFVPLDDHRITVVEMRGPKIEALRITRS